MIVSFLQLITLANEKLIFMMDDGNCIVTENL